MLLMVALMSSIRSSHNFLKLSSEILFKMPLIFFAVSPSTAVPPADPIFQRAADFTNAGRFGSSIGRPTEER